MKKKILLFTALACATVGFAQKRNMFPAYSFEITGENLIGAQPEVDAAGAGHLLMTNKKQGGNLDATIDAAGITGKSLKVVVKALPTSGEGRDNAVRYHAEVFAEDVLEIRFKAKADRATSFEFGAFVVMGTGNDLLAATKVDVTTEVKEYVFQTTASTANTVQALAFQFGTADTEVNSVFYFDDLSIVKVNTDWDGNLIKNGKFDIPSLEYSLLDYNRNGNQHTYAFDNTDALGSGQSLKITNLWKDADWHGNLKSHYLGSGTQYRISYKAKNEGQVTTGGGGGTKIGIGRTWDISGNFFPIPPYPADGYKWQPDLLLEQEIDFTFNEDVTEPRASANNHFVLAFGWYPVGNFWIDDLRVEQIGLTSIQVVEWARAESSVQLWVNATPSSANNKVTFSINTENSTGEGNIDANGLLTVTKAGLIEVKAVSLHKNTMETTYVVDASDMAPVSINSELADNKELLRTQYYTLSGVSVGEDQSTLSKGIYLYKNIYSDESVETGKVIIEK